MTPTTIGLLMIAGIIYAYLATGCVVYVLAGCVEDFTEMDTHPSMIYLWPVFVLIALVQCVLWPFDKVYGWWESSREYQKAWPAWEEQRNKLLETARKYNLGFHANDLFYVSPWNWVQDYLDRRERKK